jgi:addiction module RelE/StbE family toxin
MRLFWTETARQDLQAIRRYIAADNPNAAKKWVDRLKERARNALHSPFAGRKVTEFARDDIRELIEGNYRIVYQVLSDRLIILTVFEGHQLLPAEKITESI